MRQFFLKLLLIFIGVTLASCGIAILYAINIGTDPISVFVDGQHHILGLDYGTVNLIDSIIYLTIALIFCRNLISFATFIVGFAMGPLINLFLEIFKKLITSEGSFTLQLVAFNGLIFVPPDGNFLIKLLILIPAVILLSCGLGLYLSANMGAAPVDAVVLFISKQSKKPFRKVKIAFDFCAATLGFLSGGVIGVGTIIAIVLIGPTISFTIKIISNRINW